MKVALGIVQPITVNVVDDLTGLGSRDLTMLPLSAASPASIAQLQIALLLLNAMPVRSFNAGICGDRRWYFSCRSDHLVASSVMLARREAINLLLICEKSITMPTPHLVVAPAHLSGDHRPLTILTGATDNFSSPAIIWRTVLLHALVVHQTIAVSGVFSAASINAANSIFLGWCHLQTISQKIDIYKFLRNLIVARGVQR